MIYIFKWRCALIDFNKLCLRNVLLSEQSSYEIGGQADYFALPKIREELKILLTCCQTSQMPFTLFGMGSNILFPDKPKKGKLVISLKHYLELDYNNNKLFISSGVPLSFLSLIGLLIGIDNLSFTYLLPGSFGAGIYMNAKYFDVQVGDILDTVYYIETNSDNFEIRQKKSNICSFSYKHSIFQEQNWIIIGADIQVPSILKEDLFSLKRLLKQQKENKTNLSTLKNFYHFYSNKSSEICKNLNIINTTFNKINQDRTGKMHFDYPSCGSVFKNNYDFGIPIGVVVDKLGLKGMSRGGAMIAPHHGNIIINTGGAKAEDVLYLIKLIQEAVEKAHGFVPEPELVIVKD